MVTVPACAADGAGEGGCDGLGVCAARVTPAMAKAPQAAMICRPMILPPRPTERTRSPARLQWCRIRARRCLRGLGIGYSPGLQPGTPRRRAKKRPRPGHSGPEVAGNHVALAATVSFPTLPVMTGAHFDVRVPIDHPSSRDSNSGNPCAHQRRRGTDRPPGQHSSLAPVERSGLCLSSTTSSAVSANARD